MGGPGACVRCGGVLPGGRRSDAVYCSGACKGAARVGRRRRGRADARRRRCRQCQGWYGAGRADGVFCSDLCRVSWHRGRAAGWQLAVGEVSREEARALVLANHYTGRVPGIRHAWGLYRGPELAGVVLYSVPASYTLCRGVCGPEYAPRVLELSRLVVTTRVKNAASYLIGQSLQRLPGAVVVSYADPNPRAAHRGTVYLATNWLYTGRGNPEPVWLHPHTGAVISYTRRHIDVKARALGLDWRELKRVPQEGKHRFVTFTGDRRFRRAARVALRWPVLPYPR